MKRAKIGDVYAFKTERGYRIMQFAYSIPKEGKFFVVFPGFFLKKPIDINDVIDNEWSYIINFNVHRLYTKGVVELWGNYSAENFPPFPTHELEFRRLGNNILFEISDRTSCKDSEYYIGDSSGNAILERYEDFGNGIPEKYKDLKLLNLMPHPITFLYMLTSDFDLKHFDLFWAKDDELDEIDKKYSKLIFGEDLCGKF